MEILKAILPYLLPPLLGAIIGFITNAIAISMLFRPYTEKRIFKIRVPFTPGILPRQRYDFAESVGNMVQQQLLTEDALRRQTESPAFRESIRNYISGFTREILDLKPRKILDMVNKSGTDTAVSTLINEFWNLLKKSSIASELIDDILAYSLDYIGERKISELAALAKKVGNSDSTSTVFGQDSIKNGILYYVDTLICNIIRANPAIGDILTEDRENKILSTIEVVYPFLLHSLVRWLRQENTFRELTYRGRIIVKNIINKLSALQKFIVTAGQYDKTIGDKMDEIINDIIRQIETSGNSKQNKAQVFAGISSEISALRSKTLSDLLQHKSITVHKLIHNFSEALIDSVFRELKSENQFTPELPGGSEKIRDLLSTFTEISWEELHDIIKKSLKSGFSKSNFSAGSEVINLVKTMLDSRQDTKMFTILGLNNAFKDRLDSYMSEQAINLINSKVPEILNSINVKELVVEKINSLDIKNVEKILLSVIQKHLKWINIFGAFLGALIGMIQIFSGRFF